MHYNVNNQINYGKEMLLYFRFESKSVQNWYRVSNESTTSAFFCIKWAHRADFVVCCDCIMLFPGAMFVHSIYTVILDVKVH